MGQTLMPASLPLFLRASYAAATSSRAEDGQGRSWGRERDVPAAHEHAVPSADDAALVIAVKASDERVYERLFLRLFAPLVHFAMHYVRSRDVAEEIVADVFAVVWEQRDGWAPRNVDGFFYRAVRNRALNVTRDDRRRAQQHAKWVAMETSPGLGHVPEPAERIEHRDQWVQLKHAISHLTERQRTILALRWEYELNWNAIADTLDMTVSAAQTEHTRILRALRAFLPDSAI